MNKVRDPEKHKTYKPVFPEKYIGKELPVIRSSWEESFMKYCDMTPSIVKWASEPIAIEYTDPVSQKDRRYYPDFMLKIKDKEGKETIHIVELKPERDIKPPVKGKNKSEKTLIKEASTYHTNMAKFRAAMLYCKKRHIEFHVLSEKSLFQ